MMAFSKSESDERSNVDISLICENKCFSLSVEEFFFVISYVNVDESIKLTATGKKPVELGLWQNFRQ